MFVAASTDCFSDLPFDTALERLVDLEFTSVEISLDENGKQIKPSQVHADLERAIALCRETYRLSIAAYNINVTAEGELYYEQFTSCCKLAKATKVVTVVMPAAPLGTPFNAEIERLRRLVSIGTREGVVVGVKTETDHITQDPDTAVVLCTNVKGLGLTLDPSHYIFGPHRGNSYDQVLDHVVHVHLRDTSKDKLQVRVGQGEVEYGKLISQLSKVHYNRALSVLMWDMPEVDKFAELRKLRLLLESLM